jgi:hypothetical protein
VAVSIQKLYEQYQQYQVQIQSVRDRFLECRVTEFMSWRRGSAHALFPSRTLALQFLCESAFDEGVLRGDFPLGRAIEREYPRPFPPLNLWDYGANPDGPARSREAYEAWLKANINRFISCVGVVDRDHFDCQREWGEDGKPLWEIPQATYVISVTDPQWLAHLRPGIVWESLAFIILSDTFADVAGAFEAPPGTFPRGEWRSEDVMLLARGIEQDGAFDRLPVLADALEEAGCDDRVVLDHCRGPGPHGRGCWVVDLVLSKG